MDEIAVADLAALRSVASASVPSVACGSGATPPVAPVPTPGGTAA